MPTISRPSSDSRRLSAGRALGLFVLYTVAFAVGGGLAAGIMAFAFDSVATGSYDSNLYAITFGVTGFIAYRLAQRVAEG